MGGLRVLPDLALDELRPEDSSLLVLTGASLWDTSGDLAPFARTARAFLDSRRARRGDLRSDHAASRARACSTTGRTPARSRSTW